MKIKNIRQFRTFFKEEIREIDSTNRDENFIGTRHQVEGKGIYGFFEIYHGYKEGYGGNDGIRGFLEGFLDMAKDGQAVYEFMQNAVDAGSTRFALFWGTDETDKHPYLLVVNNGEMFDMDSIGSILNVGVSTKSSDSHTIGKFGIGFKLAHRLVGKENGLDELIHDNFGPVLFSWKNNEWLQLPELANKPEVVPINQEYKILTEDDRKEAVCSSDEPWLFKILITNFPCLPENNVVPESIFDYHYRHTDNAFTKTELQALGRWASHVQQHLSGEDFQEGSLFFIRLGQGKKAHLEEENLAEGVRFSLAILNRIAKIEQGLSGLQEVRLNEAVLSPAELLFESFTVEKGSDDFRYIRFGKAEGLTETELATEDSDSEIEILFGYTEWEKSKTLFTNAPSFYLFFPLSEEKHPFRFIIHSNAFYKSSSRTYLQRGSSEQDGINERLFEVFSRKMSELLDSWAAAGTANDREKFLQVYANLLLSNSSENPERQWVNEPLWMPLLQYLQTNIPVKDSGSNFQIASKSDHVKIKASALPVELWCDNNIEWFWWGQDHPELYLESISESKLSISRWTVIDLLELADISSQINPWLKQNPEARKILLSELNNELIGRDGQISDLFKSNLAAIELWECSDEKASSINELADQQMHTSHVLMFDKIDPLRGYLAQAGFHLSKVSLAEYGELNKYIQTSARYIKYLNDYGYLNEVFSHRFKQTSFSPDDKKNILQLLTRVRDDRTKEDRIERMRELSLFRNNAGDVVPLKNLLKKSEHEWLHPWCIDAKEYFADLDDYLVLNEDDIYEQIIYQHWDGIVGQYDSNTALLKNIFEVTKAYFSLTPKANTLSERKILATRLGLISADDEYYYSLGLNSIIHENEYKHLESAFLKFGIGPIPFFQLLPFYQDRPFKIDEISLNPAATELVLSPEEAAAFLDLCEAEWDEVFKMLIFSQTDGNIQVRSIIEGESQIGTVDEGLQLYLDRYHNGEYIPLPPSLSKYESLLTVQSEELAERLIDAYDITNQSQFADILNFVSSKSAVIKHKMIGSVESLVIDLQAISKESPESLLISLLVSSGLDQNAISSWIKQRLTIKNEDELHALKEAIYTSKDELQIEIDDTEYLLSVAEILKDSDSLIGRTVEQLINKLDQFGVGNREVLDHCFGLTQEVNTSVLFSKLSSALGSNKNIQNAQQLAFISLYKTLNTQADIDQFTVTCEGGTFPLKGNTFYCSENVAPYTAATDHLDVKYHGLSALLRLNHRLHFRIPGVNTFFFAEPFFQGSDFMVHGIDPLTEDNMRLSLLDCLFKHFGSSSEEEIKNIQIKPDTTKWADLLGFEPELTIEAEETLPSERLPSYISEWLDLGDLEVTSNRRRKFLQVLNVSFSGSDIAKARRFLKGKESHAPSLYGSLPIKLIRNTLTWIQCEKLVFKPGDQELLNFLLTLYLKSEFTDEDFPLPVPTICETDTLCFEIRICKQENTLILPEYLQPDLESIGFLLEKLPAISDHSIIIESLMPENVSAILREKFNYLEIEFDKPNISLVSSKFSQEWVREFYEQWKIEYPGSLIYILEGEIPRIATFREKVIHTYEKGDFQLLGGNIFLNGHLSDRTLIDLIEKQSFLSEESMEALKQAFEKYDHNIQHYISRIQSNERLRAEWENLQKQLEEEELKKQLTENFGKSSKYSTEWFSNLLDLMVQSGGQSDLNNPFGTLSFHKIEYNPEDLRILSLKDPSTLISPNIEQFTDFKAEFYWLNEKSKEKKTVIALKGVSKKEGQSLYALPSDTNDFQNIPLDAVKRVELTFSRQIDLLNRLRVAFNNLALPPEANLKDQLTDNIQFIYGPPGTGKTTRIADLVLSKIRSGKGVKLLILTPTNKAADVLAERILQRAKEEDYVESWLTRYGTTASTELIDSHVFYDNLSFNLETFRSCVFITTIHRYPYEKVIVKLIGDIEEKEGIDEIAWDTIVFDEASMIPLTYITYTLYKASSVLETSEFIIGGDPLQIPPVVILDDEILPESEQDVREENIYSMIGLRSFKAEEQQSIPKYGSKIINLDTQYRSIELIGDLFGKFQYHGLIKHGRKEGLGGSAYPRKLPDYFEKLGFLPITIIRYPVNTLDTIYEPQKLNKSPIHLYSAFLINELIKRFNQEIPENENWNIGTICPYRSQATLMNKMIESQNDRKPNLTLVTDTVHGFQGDQCDLVFALFNPSSKNAGYSRFLKKEYIINVAISRAQDYLILLLPDEDTEGLGSLSLIHKQYPDSILGLLEKSRKEGQVSEIKATDIEEILMGNNGYFEKNSFTNVHQAVNVYGDPEMDYMVRINGSALDIHWKNNHPQFK